jgi:hypothetical protein
MATKYVDNDGNPIGVEAMKLITRLYFSGADPDTICGAANIDRSTLYAMMHYTPPEPVKLGRPCRATPRYMKPHLTDVQRKEIIFAKINETDEFGKPISNVELARRYNVNRATIAAILNKAVLNPTPTDPEEAMSAYPDIAFPHPRNIDPTVPPLIGTASFYKLLHDIDFKYGHRALEPIHLPRVLEIECMRQTPPYPLVQAMNLFRAVEALEHNPPKYVPYQRPNRFEPPKPFNMEDHWRYICKLRQQSARRNFSVYDIVYMLRENHEAVMKAKKTNTKRERGVLTRLAAEHQVNYASVQQVLSGHTYTHITRYILALELHLAESYTIHPSADFRTATPFVTG